MAAVPSLIQNGSGAITHSTGLRCHHSLKMVKVRRLGLEKELCPVVGLIKHPVVLQQGAALAAPERLGVNFKPVLHTEV